MIEAALRTDFFVNEFMHHCRILRTSTWGRGCSSHLGRSLSRERGSRLRLLSNRLTVHSTDQNSNNQMTLEMWPRIKPDVVTSTSDSLYLASTTSYTDNSLLNSVLSFQPLNCCNQVRYTLNSSLQVVNLQQTDKHYRQKHIMCR